MEPRLDGSLAITNPRWWYIGIAVLIKFLSRYARRRWAMDTWELLAAGAALGGALGALGWALRVPYYARDAADPWRCAGIGALVGGWLSLPWGVRRMIPGPRRLPPGR
jgi:hypothetical protein